MDADILRLILFLAGIGLILGIYFWDRQKRNAAKSNAVRRAQQEGVPGLGAGWIEPPATDEVPAATETIEDDLVELQQVIHDPNPALNEGTAGEQTRFSFSAEEPDDISDERLPRKILQINLLARREAFSGDAIMQAVRDVDLIHGPMDIFHRYLGDKRSKIIFSMANLVEPGNFDINKIGELSTPGLTLFAQLPGPLDGISLLEEMLSVAQRLAALLDGEIQDDTHSDMSKQTIEHLREEIVEFERQVRLARKKR